MGGYGEPGKMTNDPHVETVRAKLAQRSAVGIAKYGTTTARKDIDLAGWMLHLQEELLDAAVYIERVISDLERGR